MKKIDGLQEKNFRRIKTGYNSFVAVMRLGQGNTKDTERNHFGESPKLHWSDSLKSERLKAKEV